MLSVLTVSCPAKNVKYYHISTTVTALIYGVGWDQDYFRASRECSLILTTLLMGGDYYCSHFAGEDME